MEKTAERLAGSAQIAERSGDWAALRALCLQWVGLDAQNAEPWRLLARAQWEVGDFTSAMEAYRAYLARTPSDAAKLTAYGRLCMYALEHDQAKAALLEAERMDPSNAGLLSAMATLFMLQGELGGARSYAERALQLSPLDTSALRVLAEVNGGGLPEARLAALRAVATRTEIIMSERASMHFLIGDSLDARGEFDAAFSAYSCGNELMLADAGGGARYDRALQSRRTEDMIARLQQQPAAQLDADCGITPIFIVGSPRSGTTLIESVFAAHPKVAALGERVEMRRIAQEHAGLTGGGQQVDAATLRRWRDAYLRNIPNRVGVEAIVDKNPFNYDSIGLIRLIFPQARIVHVRRNPVETGLSIFRHQFAKFMTFANRLEDIGHFYGQYARLMAHCGDAAPILTIQYEDFVAGFDRTGHDLLDACGLVWDDACARFWTSPRVVATLTTVQARRPLKGARRRASHYAAHLTPLISELEAGEVDLSTGEYRRRGSST